MIKRTTWYPDTCDCIIEYEWDDSISENLRVHTVVNVQRCPIHLNQLSDVACFATVNAENTLKNIG